MTESHDEKTSKEVDKGKKGVSVWRRAVGGRAKQQAELKSRRSLPGLWPLCLRLSCNGVHDGVLRVQANGCVVLGVDDSGLTARAFHLDWPMGKRRGGV